MHFLGGQLLLAPKKKFINGVVWSLIRPSEPLKPHKWFFEEELDLRVQMYDWLDTQMYTKKYTPGISNCPKRPEIP